MGVDWIRYQLKPGIDTKRFSKLIEDQSRLFIECGFLIEGELAAFLGRPTRYSEPPENVLEAYRAVSGEMRELIEIDSANDANYSRVYPLTDCTVFPLEWRIEAQRTYLPEDVPKLLDRWRLYSERVLAEKYQAYLNELYIYVEPFTFRDCWADVVSMARRAKADKRLEVYHSESRFLLNNILNFPELPLPPAPRWDDWRSNPHATLTNEAILRNRMRAENMGACIDMIHRWDHLSNEVWKMEDYPDSGLGLDYRQTNIGPGSWFAEFIEWVDGCAKGKMGLWLDY